MRQQLLSGSVHAYQSRLSSPPACYMRLPDVVASFDDISQPHVLPLSFHFLHRILATPRCQNLLPFSAMSLCYAYAYAYAYPPLCISTSVAYLPSGTTRHILTAKCLSAAYPGIQQMVLFSPSHTHTFSVPFCNVMSILLTLLNCAWRACDFFFSFCYQRACGITFPSSAKSTPARSSGTPMASRAVLLSSRSKIRLRLTQSWSGNISWMERPSVCYPP